MHPRKLVVFLAQAITVGLALAFLLTLFWPGYSLVAALFPQWEQLHASQRTAMSLGLSIAIVVLVGLGLNYSPWGVRRDPILASLDGVIVLGLATAALRRRLSRQPRLPQTAGPPRQGASWRRRLVASLPAAVLLTAAVGFAAAIYLTASSATDAERFTEFYVLGPDGRADSYPETLREGETATVVVGVANREGHRASYRVFIESGGSRSEVGSFALADGQRWERAATLTPTARRRGREFRFLLYRNAMPGSYRRLYLRLDVEQALVDEGSSEEDGSAAPAAAAVAAAAQAPAPAATGPAPPRLHVVTAGENLTFISRRYQVPLADVIAANPLDDPDLIYPRQQILIPGPPGGQ